MLNPVSEISQGNISPVLSCIALCETQFRTNECAVAQVRCDETTSICQGLRWTNHTMTRLCLEPTCGKDAIAIPCMEARTLLLKRTRGGEGEESKSTSQKRVGFLETGASVRVFKKDSLVNGEDVVVSPKSSSVIPVTGIDWGLVRQVLYDLRQRTSIERTNSQDLLVFPGIQACLGVPPQVMINTRQGAISSVYFDQEFVAQMESVSPNSIINSSNGLFSLWRLPYANSATWFKAVGGALNGMNGMGVKVFDLQMTNPACEPWLMLTEAQGREQLGLMDSPILTNLSVGEAKRIAVRLFETVKYLHKRGLVHLSLHNSFYYDGTNVESIKVGNYGVVKLFVDPSGSHVSVDNCISNPKNTFMTIRYPPPNNCISRHVDFEDIYALLKFVVAKRLVTDPPNGIANELVANFDKFGQEVSLMGFMDTLDYDKWITIFRN